jgi:hypothetical protein
MDEHAVLVAFVEGVAADVGAPIHEQDARARVGEALGRDGTGKTGADDKKVGAIADHPYP